MKTINELVAQNIISRRKALGLNQKELAKKAKVNAIGLNRIEKGKRRAGPNVIAALAEALNCRPEVLYTNIDAKLSHKEMRAKMGKLEERLAIAVNALKKIADPIQSDSHSALAFVLAEVTKALENLGDM